MARIRSLITGANIKLFPRLAVWRSTMRGYNFVISWLTWSGKSAMSAWCVAPLSARLGWGLSTSEVWVCHSVQLLPENGCGRNSRGGNFSPARGGHSRGIRRLE